MKAKTLVEALHGSIEHNWNLSALTDFDQKGLTYGEVAGRITWLHLLLQRAHIRPGDKIALLGKNSVNWALCYLATVMYGAAIVPILPDFHPSDVHHIVNHSDSALLLVADNLFEKLDIDKMPDCSAFVSLDRLEPLGLNKKTVYKAFEKMNEEFPSRRDIQVEPDSFVVKPVSPEATATINYTSGTSGFSKGVELSHASLMSNIRYGQENMPLVQGDRILSFLPLAHSYGCAFEFLFPFTLGCHITFLCKTPSPRIIMEAFARIRPQLILSVPLIIEKIYRKQVKPVLQKRMIRAARKLGPINKLLQRKLYQKLYDAFGGKFHELVIGGAALNPEVEDFFRSISFPLTVGYGMTECGPLIAYSPWKSIRARSVGTPVDRMEVRIDSADPAGVVGEIMVRGVHVMKGYYKNPQATAEALDEHGWLHTGDLGLMDKEGFVYIKGRSKNMILGSSGQNIYPEEIESKLDNQEFVMESLVMERENQISALVYPDFDRVYAAGMTETDLERHFQLVKQRVNHELPAYSKIARIEVYPEEFEKTPTRKIKRFLYTIPAAGTRPK
ncbi:MAG TPA: long-chain fatty acid--CoA ligase [Candidatus Aminicenantes bacterium]|nr:long-chain fatty acid--CoA ligase [Candidatus Aminicenantes bacterium]